MSTMKNIYTAAFMLVVGVANAQSNFEGVITLNTTNEAMKESASITWYLKGDDSRMDIDSKAGDHSATYAVISDEKGMDMVAEGQVTPVPQAAMKVDMSSQEIVSETPNVTVNGFTCTKVVYTDGSNLTTYWLADGLEISFDDLPFIIKRNMPKISSNGFPVKMIKRDSSGKVILSQEVVSITQTAVADSRFERN